MNLKEELNSLVNTVIENSKVDGKPTINNTDIAGRLGIDRGYLSTLKGEKGKVDEVLIKAFKYEFAKELNNSTSLPNAPEFAPGSKVVQDAPAQAITTQAWSNLTNANLVMAEAHKIFALANLNYSEANKTLAENSRDLIGMAKTTANVEQQTFEAFDTKIRNVLESIAEVVSDKEPWSKQQVNALLHRAFHGVP